MRVNSSAPGVPSSGGYAYVTLLDLDLTAQASQTLSPDGPYTIGGFTFQKLRSSGDATPLALVNGTGIVWNPANNTAKGGVPPLAAPALELALFSLAPMIQPSSQVRVWSKWADDPATLNSFQDCGITSEQVFPLTTGGGGFLAVAYRAFDASIASAHGVAYGTLTYGATRGTVNEVSLPLAGDLNAGNRVLVWESLPLLGVQARVLLGPNTSPWPNPSALTLATAVVNTTPGTFQNQRGLDQSALWSAELGAAGSLTTVLQRIRVDVAI